MRLFRPTEILRETVSQEARCVLEAMPDGDGGGPTAFREVQVLVPEGDGLFLAVDMPIQKEFDEPGIGPNRTYKMPPMPTGQAIVVRLLAHQYLTAMAESGTVKLALIIEYIED